MTRIAAFITLFCCLVMSEAQHEAGQCAFYEECGLNPTVDQTLIRPIIPCFNPSPARRLSREHYNQLIQVCPMLDRGFDATTACCSISQLRSLYKSLALAKALLNRCPSCAENFAHLHCATTCSPNQSQFIKVTRTMNITNSLNIVQEAVVGYQAYINRRFARESFQSCKNVRIPVTGELAISTMCGGYGAECTAQRWYDFQGDSSNGLAPLDIDFYLFSDKESDALPDGLVAYNGAALKCNEKTSSGGEACSCQDCVEAC